VMLTGELPFSVANETSKTFREYCDGRVLPSEEGIPPLALQDLKVVLAVTPAARPLMPQVCGLPWVAEGLLIHGLNEGDTEREHKASEDTPSNTTVGTEHEGPNEGAPSASAMSTSNSIATERSAARPAPKRAHSVDAWDGRPTAWEIGDVESELVSMEAAEESSEGASASVGCAEHHELPHAAKVRRIGWAIHEPKPTVLEILHGILTELGMTTRLDADTRLVVGEQGDLTLGVSVDEMGVSQVEWTRTGADVLRLKHVYTNVSNALNRRNPGKWVHRYGEEALEIPTD